MDEKNISRAVRGIAAVLEVSELSPLEKVAALGSATESLAGAIDVAYSVERKPAEEVFEGVMGVIGDILDKMDDEE